jgi:pyruvate ferredoxin oxidoreductase beta subunit
MKALGNEDTNVVAWAGDGGTGDIGLQALSGACERGENIIYICYDNEAYMNTGVQRSGTTPLGVITTTTPVSGKLQSKKDVPSIIAAHGIEYIASCSASYPIDLYDKIKKATTIKGTKYIHVHTPCPPGWGFDASLTVKTGKLAVQTGMFDLYEIDHGKFRLTGESAKMPGKKRKPVEDYLDTQTRFKSLSKDVIQRIKDSIDTKWEGYAGSA